MHLSYAEVNLSRLKRNFLNIRKKIKKVKIMAVVKAEGYGHGIIETARLLESLGEKKPEYFAVAFSDEAIEIRKAGIMQPILIFEPFSKSQVKDLFQYNFIATVFNREHIRILKEGAKKYSSNKSTGIKVHVKVNTGMNRLGIDYNKAEVFITELSKDTQFIIDGIYTHFAVSEEKDKSFSKIQIKRFKQVLEKLKEKEIKYGLVHAANSGAILDLPESYFDMVRPGILLHGYYPSLETSESIKLEPVMSLISRVSSVSKIKKGETVGYGRKYTAKKETTIISVPIGYADGFSRGLSNHAKGIINGKIYNQIGTVSMDRISFEIGNDKINVGDKVILLGKDKNNEISVWDWCKILNTIPFEVICGIRKRIDRVYIK